MGARRSRRRGPRRPGALASRGRRASPLERLVDLRAFERRQRKDGTTPHGRLVAGGGEDGGKAGGVADRSERPRPRLRGRAHRRARSPVVRGARRQRAAPVGRDRSARRTPTPPSRPRWHRRRRAARAQPHSRPGGSAAAAASATRRRTTASAVGGGARQVFGRQRAGACQRAERGRTDPGIFVVERDAHRGHVATVTGERHVSLVPLPALVRTGVRRHCTAFLRPVRIKAPPSTSSNARKAPSSASSALNTTIDRARTHHGVGVTRSAVCHHGLPVAFARTASGAGRGRVRPGPWQAGASRSSRCVLRSRVRRP